MRSGWRCGGLSAAWLHGCVTRRWNALRRPDGAVVRGRLSSTGPALDAACPCALPPHQIRVDIESSSSVTCYVPMAHCPTEATVRCIHGRCGRPSGWWRRRRWCLARRTSRRCGARPRETPGRVSLVVPVSARLRPRASLRPRQGTRCQGTCERVRRASCEARRLVKCTAASCEARRRTVRRARGTPAAVKGGVAAITVLVGHS